MPPPRSGSRIPHPRSGTILRACDNNYWGDIPTWVTAIATVLALVAAGFAAHSSWNVLKHEREREADRRRRAEQAEQADLVAVLPAPGRGRAVIQNASALPVYRVVVVYVVKSGERHESPELAVVPPGRLEGGVGR